MEQKKFAPSSRALLIVISVICVLVGLDACRGLSSASLTVLGEDVPTVQSYKALGDEYTKSTNGKTKLNFVLDEYTVMVNKADQDFSNGTSVYDIVLQYNTALSSYIRNGYVITLDEIKSGKLSEGLDNQRFQQIEQDIFPNTWHEVGYYKLDGSYERPVALPFSANTMFLCYNKKLFSDPNHQQAYEKINHEKLEPPKTWEQLERIAKYFSSQNGLHGISLQGAQYFIVYEWSNIAFSMGGGVMRKEWGWSGDEHTPLILDSPETIEATKFYLRLKDYDGSDDFFNYDAVHQRERMKRGDIAMGIMWSDVAFDLIRGNTEGNYDETFGFVPIPGNKSMLAGGAFYINKNSKHSKEAVEYILNQLQRENQIKLMQRGLCSPLRSAYDSEEVKKIPYADALRRSLDQGVYMLEAGPDADAIQVKLSEVLQRLFRDKGAVTVEQAMHVAQQDVASIRTDIFRQLKNQDKDKQKKP